MGQGGGPIAVVIMAVHVVEQAAHVLTQRSSSTKAETALGCRCMIYYA